jgi:hypothetical protein
MILSLKIFQCNSINKKGPFVLAKRPFECITFFRNYHGTLGYLNGSLTPVRASSINKYLESLFLIADSLKRFQRISYLSTALIAFL